MALATCTSCRQVNNVTERPGQPICGRCGWPLVAIDHPGTLIHPATPVRPWWTTLRGFLEYLRAERRLPPFIPYWRRLRTYRRAMKVYRIEYSARSEWERMYRELAFERLDGLTGAEFERRLAILFEQQGYRVSETPGSGDQGADLVLSCGESPKSRIAIQAKR